MQAAERGDERALHEAIAAREKAGDLSTSEAASLAKTVAERDLRLALPTDALERVRDARPCAHELDDALAARMQTHDAAGAEGALARIEAHMLSLDDVRSFASDPDGSWRAVGVRALVRPEDRAPRLRALLDPDPRVRRQAARASRDAGDLADLSVLAEAARVDPEPIVRTEAVRAIAALPPTPSGQTANTLRDLWTVGDDGLREDIALAWASPGVWSSGGQQALRTLIASDHGPGVIEGAAAVLRHHDANAETRQAAVGQIARSIEAGSRSTRLQALAEAPLDVRELLDAVRAAARDDDREVRVAALARLLETNDGSARTELEALAQPGAPTARRARFALASAGDRRVQAWIEQDLAAPSAADRLGAATALASLDVPARGAPLLADADVSVRVRAACTILLAARRSP